MTDVQVQMLIESFFHTTKSLFIFYTSLLVSIYLYNLNKKMIRQIDETKISKITASLSTTQVTQDAAATLSDLFKLITRLLLLMTFLENIFFC